MDNEIGKAFAKEQALTKEHKKKVPALGGVTPAAAMAWAPIGLLSC